MAELPHILVGCEGEYRDPKAAFYPEDIPEDWRLSFYSTSFTALLLDAEHLLDAPLDVVAGWSKDVQATFRFLIVIHAHFSDEARESLRLRLQALGEHLGGLVFFARDHALAEIPARVADLGGKVPVFVHVESAPQWSQVLGHGYFPCWRSLAEVQALPAGQALMHGLLLLAEADREPRQLRALLEAMDGHLERQGSGYLIYAEPQPEAQVMQNGVTLCELLGIL